MTSTPSWSEQDSAFFLERGRILTPHREEIGETILTLLEPAQPDEEFLVVELGIGGGWLSRLILERFPNARILGLDGSATMLEASRANLEPFLDRVTFDSFQLEDPSWLRKLPSPPRAFVSSLVIHHLDGPAKARLYRDLYYALASPGHLLIADLIEPQTCAARKFAAESWEAEVKKRSLEITGSLDTYDEFLTSEWNYFEHPDPADKPSPTTDHITWLQKAGYYSARVFWERAGFAVYGGFKG